MNQLYYGDNLDILREHIADDSVDLIYLDPPFNSSATYNVLFKAPDGHESHAQMEAFEDTWHWNKSAEHAFDEVMQSGNTDAAEMLRAMRSFLHDNDMMAYLAMMAVRLIELHRVLKQTGSLYLHCDPTASHYLKILLDAIFGKERFKNEIIWRRSAPKGHAYSRFATTHDVILSFDKSETAAWNASFIPYDPEYIKSHYSNVEPETGRRYQLDNTLNPNPDRPNLTYKWNGHVRVWRWTKDRMQRMHDEGRLIYTRSGMPRYKRYLDEMPGIPITDVWDDIPPINSQAQERLGYPTQKPLPLLERILTSSSKEGDVVLDPFCGCGTTVHAAQTLNRQWIGIDVTHLSISLIQKRLRDAFGAIPIDVHGVPRDLDGARALATQDKYQFQWWAVSLVDAVPYGGKKKGADSGIDGFIYFKPDGKTTEKAIVSVKGGDNVDVKMIRELAQVVNREKAKIGVLICLADPTGPMKKEAIAEGFYKTEYGEYPKVQILTVEQLFAGKRPDMPWIDPTVFKKAAPEKGKQGKLL
jgi:site-specific DNA-methyltransferase (adenine-specific)